jgi:hypothetical protein
MYHVGGSQYIIDGKIKLKNDSQILTRIYHKRIKKFEDGSKLEAVVRPVFIHMFQVSEQY